MPLGGWNDVCVWRHLIFLGHLHLIYANPLLSLLRNPILGCVLIESTLHLTKIETFLIEKFLVNTQIVNNC